jgi:hypothetical protein
MPINDLVGPITTRTLVIENLDTFILNNIPYGVVRPTNVQWGSIVFDGPRAPGLIGSKAALQWYFGGVAYPITKAIRVFYTYKRTWDGSDAVVTDGILIGFQENLLDHIVAQPIPFVSTYSRTYFARRDNLGLFGDSTNLAWGSQPAILASEAAGVVTAAPQQFAAPPQQPGPNFDALIKTELARGDHAAAYENLIGHQADIDFDGPAQEQDSHNIFPYTLASLINEQEKYARVQFWYFAGIPRRVVKAIRIPLDIGSDARDQAAGALGILQERGKAGDLGISQEGGREPNVPWRTKPQVANEQPARAAFVGSRAEEAQAEAKQGHALFIGFLGGSPTGGG